MTDEKGEPAAEESGRRGLLDSIIPELVRKAITQGAEALAEDKVKDTLVAELFRRAVTKGGLVVDTLQDSPLPKEVVDRIREIPLPKEVVERVTGRVDGYRAELLRVVRTEVREFLDRIDLGYELQKMLTSLSFEITTEVRFIPNDKGVKPDIKARARVKRTRGRRKDKSESASPAEAAPEPTKTGETP